MWALSLSMNGENRLLVADEPDRLKFKTSGELPIVLEELGESSSI
jgi:hypothetical protein